MICPTGGAKYFCAQDWTVDSVLIALWKFDFWRNAMSVIPGWSEGPDPESITPQQDWAKWIPGSR